MPRVGELRPVAAAEDHWKACVVRHHSDRTRTVEGVRYGNVLVHPSFDHEGRWNVALLPSERTADLDAGNGVRRYETETDARKVGEALMRHCVLAIRRESLEEIRAAIPPWVKPWVRAMMLAGGKFLDPDPYRKGEIK